VSVTIVGKLQSGLQWRNSYRLSLWPWMWFKNAERGHPVALCNYSVTNWLFVTVWFKIWKGETEGRCGDLLNLLGSTRNESRIMISKRSPFQWVVHLIKRKSVRPELSSSGYSARRWCNFRSLLNLRSPGLCNSRVSRHCVCESCEISFLWCLEQRSKMKGANVPRFIPWRFITGDFNPFFVTEEISRLKVSASNKLGIP